MEYACKICSRPFSNSQSLNSHVRHCRLAQESKTWIDAASSTTLDKLRSLGISRTKSRPRCLVCGKETKTMRSKFCSPGCGYVGRGNGRGVARSAETRRKISNALRKNHPRQCLICRRVFKPRNSKSICCSIACGRKHASLMLTGRKNPGKGGGCREGSEYSKGGWYKGIYCGSTYELIFVVYHMEKNIEINRAVASLPYAFEGRIFQYHPDFEVSGKMYEIKGYMNPKAEAKKEQFPHIIIVEKKEIARMQAESSLAGKKWPEVVTLYDKSNVATERCANCGELFIKPRKKSMYCSRRCGMLANRLKAR